MTSLGLSAILQLAIVAAGGETYAEAHKETVETGRPLVVLVGADWCPACNVMKNTVVPQLRQRGLLRKVAFAMVNLDHDRRLGAELTENGPIPQLVSYRRTKEGWRMQKLIGSQDTQTVENFLNQAIEASPSVAEKANTPDAAKETSHNTVPAPGKKSPEHG